MMKLKIIIIFVFFMQEEILIAQCENLCECCGDCLNKKKENTTINNNEKEEEILFNLNSEYDLNNFDVNNLEIFLIQVLSEVFYKCQEIIYNNVLKKLNEIDLSKAFAFTTQEDLNEQIKIIEENLFKNIKKLSKENFEKIDNEYIKFLASFFLSYEDYDEYMTQQIEEMKKNFSKSENTNTINEFVNGENKDESFISALKGHIDSGLQNGGFNNNLEEHKKEVEMISEILKQCKPYDKETFRGTGIYKDKERIKGNDKEVRSSIEDFFNKIKKDNCTWEEFGLRSYTSDPTIAAFFALDAKPNFSNTKFYNIFLHCHLNKTGVNLFEAYKEEEKFKENSFSYAFTTVNEKEVLYPKESKFKILGIHIKIKEAYVSEIGGKYYKKKLENEDEDEYEEIQIIDESQIYEENSKKYIKKNENRYKVLDKSKKVLFPFLVLDLVQIE